MATEKNLTFDPAIGDRLFPFHLVLDRELRILHATPVVERLLPSLRVGDALDQVFEAVRPQGPLANITPAQFANTLLILRSRQPQELVLKGQIVPLASRTELVLLASPRVADADEMRRLGLTAADFALHDPISETLVGLQAMRASLMDAELLARRLRQARDDALEASKAKSQFLANMSHELRTPLNAIIGFTDMMVSEIHGKIPGRYAGYLRDVNTSGRHLLDLINDLLDLARIEADRFDLRPSQFAVINMVDECVRFMTPQMQRKALTAEIASPEPSLSIVADERAVKQIVLNLMSNAVKFSKPDGRIDVTVVRESVSGLRITVADGGEGIDPALIPSVFEPFRQGDSHVTRDNEGSGLGLHIASRLAQLHGGTISMQSARGAGTTVALVLPAGSVIDARPAGGEKSP